MSDQPDYLEGEVAILDALIDLYPDSAEDWTPQETDRRVVGALAAARFFYSWEKPKFAVAEFELYHDLLSRYSDRIRLSWVQLNQELGRSARYLKRYYERFPRLQGGC